MSAQLRSPSYTDSPMNGFTTPSEKDVIESNFVNWAAALHLQRRTEQIGTGMVHGTALVGELS